MAAGRPRSFCKNQALDRALEVFWRQGFEGASICDLTEAMGINPPSLYAAFGNKEQLFRQALDRYAEVYAERRAALLARSARLVSAAPLRLFRSFLRSTPRPRRSLQKPRPRRKRRPRPGRARPVGPSVLGAVRDRSTSRDHCEAWPTALYPRRAKRWPQPPTRSLETACARPGSPGLYECGPPPKRPRRASEAAFRSATRRRAVARSSSARIAT